MADDTNVEIAVEVSGEKEAEKKLKYLARAQDEATEATKRNTEAARENATANDESSGVTNEAIGWLDKQKASLEGAGASTVAFGSSLQSLSALMKGDFVGAARAAGVALKALGMAFVVNPVLASIALIGAAVAALMKRIADTKSALVDLGIAAGTVVNDANHRHLERMGDYDYGKMSDEELAQKIKALEDARDQHKRRSMELEDEAIEIANASDEILDKKGVENRTAAVESLGESAAREYEDEKKYGAELKRAQAEQRRRADEARRSAEESAEAAANGAAKGQSARDKLAQERADFERQQDFDEYAEEHGRKAALERRRDELVGRKSELEEKTASLREAGMALDLEDERALLDIDKELHEVNQQITAEKDKQAQIDARDAATESRRKELLAKRQAEAEQKQADWERSRKLDKMDASDRAAYIDNEIAQLRQGPRNADTEAKMRRLIDERNRAQDAADKDAARKKQDADELAHQRSDFLHRNDTDAQKLARIGKELGATDDQSKMLELMMAGEDVAESYQEPMTKRQQRRAKKKAERDAKSAMREARKFRKQVGEIEKGWGSGDASAQEAVAKMAAGGDAAAFAKISSGAEIGNKSARELAARLTADKNGVPSSIQNKGGKLVEVKGQDRTNQLLETIAKALS